MPARLLLVIGLWLLAGFAVAQTDVPLPPGHLPGSVDLMPEFERLGLTARLQGDRGDCSLFAVTGAVEFEVGREEHRQPSRLSEEFLIWAAHKATGTTGDQAMFYEAVHGLDVLGICSEELMPYGIARKANHRPSPAALANAKEEEPAMAGALDQTLGRAMPVEPAADVGHPAGPGRPPSRGLRAAVARAA